MHDVLVATSELCQSRISRILGSRTIIHANLTLTEIRELVDRSMLFVEEQEVLCARVQYGLRKVLLDQAKGEPNKKMG
jgi:hypothetical protein